MARPRFSEMLIQRRRQLGLSIQQASNVLRLKEQVLIAFEEGDFAAMPKSGYAQGMLSSYARYLGMNVRQVINQFSSDLFEYEHMQGRQIQSRTQRARSEQASYEEPLSQQDSSYVPSRGLLPTSGGYAGDLSDYATVSSPRSRTSYPQASPLVQSRPESSYRSDYAIGTDRALPTGQEAYYELPREGYQDAYPRDDFRGPSYSDPYAQERRYTARDMGQAPLERTSLRAQNERRLRSSSASGYTSRYQGEEGVNDRRSRDRVMTRSVSAQEYQDDLRYESARPYEAASTLNGRNASRNIAAIERPNVRRRRSGANRRPQKQLHSGILGVIEAWFEDPKRAVLTLVFGVGLLLTVIVVLSVSSCMANRSDNSRTVAVTANNDSSSSTNSSDTTPSTDSSSSSKSSEAAAAAAAAAAAKAQSDAAEANTETKVSVSVADGQVSWVEIVVDGKSEVAEQITGPWSQEYTVTEQMSVEVSNVAAVTVSKNGTQQKFDSKTSGIGTITIEGTKVTTDTTNSGDTSASNSSSSTSTVDTTNTSTTTGESTNTSSNTTTAGTSNTSSATAKSTNTSNSKSSSTSSQ